MPPLPFESQNYKGNQIVYVNPEIQLSKVTSSRLIHKGCDNTFELLHPLFSCRTAKKPNHLSKNDFQVFMSSTTLFFIWKFMKRATTTMTMTITGLRDDEELSSSSKNPSYYDVLNWKQSMFIPWIMTLALRSCLHTLYNFITTHLQNRIRKSTTVRSHASIAERIFARNNTLSSCNVSDPR